MNQPTYIDSIKGKPIERVLNRKRLADAYCEGKITKEEYDSEVAQYKAFMKELASKAFKNLRKL